MKRTLELKTGRGRKFGNFPASYNRIMEHFERSKEPVVLNGTRRQVLALRHDLYRFFEQVRKTSLLEKDETSKVFAELSRDLTTFIEPTKGDKDVPSTLTIEFRLISILDLNLSSEPKVETVELVPISEEELKRMTGGEE